MFGLYDFSMSMMMQGMKLASSFNAKVKKGVVGRRESLEKIKKTFTKEDHVIWMHAASLGEYEQGLPVLEKLKDLYPTKKILITFFSPSGYENVVKKNKWADAIGYLPFDKKHLVDEFTSHFTIDLFFTVKYDYWYRLLEALRNKNVPIYVVSALFYEKQNFFKNSGKFFVSELKKDVTLFFHQTQHSMDLAKSIGLDNSVLTGDTRYDRVKQIVANFSPLPIIESFVKDDKVLVVGSSWEAEEQIVFDFVEKNKDVKVILAPHDLKRVPQIKEKFQHNAVLYSELEKSQISNSVAQIVIIDNIGMLSRLYHYADVALVGGGFHSSGLHNILEAAAYGEPVIFGNHYRKNPEADNLIKADGAKSFAEINDTTQFLVKLFSDEILRNLMAENSKIFINSQPNSTEIILENIKLIK